MPKRIVTYNSTNKRLLNFCMPFMNMYPGRSNVFIKTAEPYLYIPAQADSATTIVKAPPDNPFSSLTPAYISIDRFCAPCERDLPLLPLVNIYRHVFLFLTGYDGDINRPGTQQQIDNCFWNRVIVPARLNITQQQFFWSMVGQAFMTAIDLENNLNFFTLWYQIINQIELQFNDCYNYTYNHYSMTLHPQVGLRWVFNMFNGHEFVSRKNFFSATQNIEEIMIKQSFGNQCKHIGNITPWRLLFGTLDEPKIQMYFYQIHRRDTSGNWSQEQMRNIIVEWDKQERKWKTTIVYDGWNFD